MRAEVMYGMAGGAEIINWARAIIILKAGANPEEIHARPGQARDPHRHHPPGRPGRRHPRRARHLDLPQALNQLGIHSPGTQAQAARDLLGTPRGRPAGGEKGVGKEAGAPTRPLLRRLQESLPNHRGRSHQLPAASTASPRTSTPSASAPSTTSSTTALPMNSSGSSPTSAGAHGTGSNRERKASIPSRHVTRHDTLKP